MDLCAHPRGKNQTVMSTLGWLNFDKIAQITLFPGLWPDFVQT